MNLPDYHHRTFAGGDNDPKAFDVADLEDSVGLLVEQAEAVILMIQNQYISKNSEVNTARTNFATLECVRKNLLDIKVMVAWFHEKEIKHAADGGQK